MRRKVLPHDTVLRYAKRGLPPRRGGAQGTVRRPGSEDMLTGLVMLLNNTMGSLDQ